VELDEVLSDDVELDEVLSDDVELDELFSDDVDVELPEDVELIEEVASEMMDDDEGCAEDEEEVEVT